MSSLMIFDVDHFKAVNDTGGHAAGDRVLVSAARVLERTLRASDTAYRWGGDEFVVLAPSIGALSAVRLAERVCAAMRSLDLPSPLGHATLSAGVAQLAPSETLEAWIGRADEALYRAKAGGRDRVELSALPTDTPAQRVVQLVWDPELECDDALVNQQHREMFNLANALLDGWTSNAPRGSVEARMTALLDHVVRHFADEEAMLQRVGYPALAQHRAQHRVLVEEALELRHRFQGGTLNVEELVSFVVGRVARDHLMGADVLFFPTVARAAASGRPGP
jgi:diguanylate cyclase (GGDEF)-like protein/hemerythrin-like metal-binding protein